MTDKETLKLLSEVASSTKDLVQRHARTQSALRVLLDPAPLGRGPIRLEAWNDSEWSQEQREAYAQLRAEAGLPETGGGE